MNIIVSAWTEDVVQLQHELFTNKNTHLVTYSNTPTICFHISLNPALQEHVMDNIFPPAPISPFIVWGLSFTPDICTQNANKLCSALPSIFPQFKTWPALRSLSPSTKLRLDTPHFANLHTSPISSLIIAEKNWKYYQLLCCYECTSPVFGAILACRRHCVPFPMQCDMFSYNTMKVLPNGEYCRWAVRIIIAVFF